METHNSFRSDCFLPVLFSVPIIVISGDDQLETRQEALEAGADAFLQKPFSLEQVAQLLIHFGVL